LNGLPSNTVSIPRPLSVFDLKPHSIQREALLALERTRQEGFTAGLVVLATGLGKTWLAAFDSDRSDYRRILFVAHREEILEQAMTTFERQRPRHLHRWGDPWRSLLTVSGFQKR
jgi:superfamily II DNA or RNA helicase